MTDETREKLQEVAELIKQGHTVTLPEDAPAGCPLCRAYVKLHALLEAEEESGAEPRGERRTIKDPGWYEDVNERIEALEELGRHNREGVDGINSAWRETWRRVRALEGRVDIAVQLIRDEAKQVKHVENRVEALEEWSEDIAFRVAHHARLLGTPEPDSEPEPEDG